MQLVEVAIMGVAAATVATTINPLIPVEFSTFPNTRIVPHHLPFPTSYLVHPVAVLHLTPQQLLKGFSSLRIFFIWIIMTTLLKLIQVVATIQPIIPLTTD